ncbi:hypothetical protein A2U01_0091112, partial [Trifolium medium]|nr:hypothetical protein [Trifolium medium]
MTSLPIRVEDPASLQHHISFDGRMI